MTGKRPIVRASLLLGVFCFSFIYFPMRDGWVLFDGSWLDSLPRIAFLSCGILAIFATFLLRNSPSRPAYLSAIVLATLIIVGLWGTNNGLEDAIGFSRGFISNRREKWEVVALISTAFMAIIYIDTIGQFSTAFQDVGEGENITPVILLLLVSVGVIGAALWKLHHIGWHYWLVLTVAVIFTLIDIIIVLSLCNADSANFSDDARKAEIKELAKDSAMLLVALDIPVFLGFAVMGFFYYSLSCPLDALDKIVPWQTTYKQAIDVKCVEIHPFLAGTLAFQMISFNAIYVVLTLKLHEKLLPGVSGVLSALRRVRLRLS